MYFTFSSESGSTLNTFFWEMSRNHEILKSKKETTRIYHCLAASVFYPFLNLSTLKNTTSHLKQSNGTEKIDIQASVY